jgi:hypothetical protein
MNDRNRDFISLLACICADSTALPLTLIYPSESGDPLDTWLDNVKRNDILHMGCSPTRWSNNGFGLAWLRQVFKPYTRRKHGQRHRILILDGYSSHVNIAFIEFAVLHQIILVVLPPHTTHRLQPLDVGCFGPLATAFLNQVAGLIAKGSGLVRTSKQLFWSMFKPAFAKSLLEKNILLAFKKTSIWP